MKKTSIVFRFLLFLLVAGVVSSCEKDPENLLTDHTWKHNKTITTSTNEDVIDLVALVNALMTGATLDFHDDGTYTLTALGQSDDGTWSISDDGDYLTMEGDEMKIIKLTASDLILQGEEVSDTYGTYVVKLYWTD